MAQETLITRKDADAAVKNLTVSGTSVLTGGVTMGALTVTPASEITTTGPLVKFTETVGFAAFTDGGSTVGTFDLTTSTIPAGTTFLFAAVTAITGFAGDTSAVLTFGDGTDVDRYNTGTADVFTTAANGIACGIPSGVVYHDAVKTVKLTITTNADFTSVSAGSVTVAMYYLA